MEARRLYAGLILTSLILCSVVPGCSGKPEQPAVAAAREPIKIYSYEKRGYVMSDTLVKTEEEWKKLLSPEEFHVLREKGTEEAGTGLYNKHHERGVYRCAACGLDLFRSEDKYDSGAGWPSFTAPIAPENVTAKADNTFFMRRTEVVCRRCQGHLGHVFEDGPKPTGLRYCMNSVALKFVSAK